jgi:hypothetical protein
MTHKYLLTAFIIFGLIMLSQCGTKEKGDAGTDKTAARDSLVIELKGLNGKSVFEIVAASHQVNFIPSEAGNFVSGIDSVESGYHYGWLYSVNDTMGLVASDRYITKDGDRIKWHFRKF